MKIKHLEGNNSRERGISLIEVTIIIVVVGIVASLALRSMESIMKDARQIETEREMAILAKAIAGDPSIMAVAGGERSEFGYVGDVGSLPPNLDALMTNPGYDTWNGPYLPPAFNQSATGYGTDAWGTAYDYTGGIEITSTGSGSDITKHIAENSDDLLSNQVTGRIRDVNDSIPATDDLADVEAVIVYPDGTGGLDTVSTNPDEDGLFTISLLPIGRHPLMVIYTPEVDTLMRYVTIVPRTGTDEVMRYNFDTAYFSTEEAAYSGLTFVPASDTAYGPGSDCHFVKFWVENTTADQIHVNSITLTYTTEAYYKILTFNGIEEFDSSTPRNGSGDAVTFASMRTVGPGSSVRVVVETFLDTPSGTGNNVDMSTTTFTVSFDDGSTFDVDMSGYCE